MKVTYEYDLSDPMDRAENDAVLVAQEMHQVIWDLDREMGECAANAGRQKSSAEWRAYLRKLANEYGVHILGDIND